MEIFSFTIGEIQLAIPLSAIKKVIRAVAVTPIPISPLIFYGLINYHGELLPVINLNHRFKLEDNPITPEHIFLIIKNSMRQIVLVADSAKGVLISKDEDIFPADFLNQPIEAKGVVRTNDGMIFIYDVEKFLQNDEIVQLDDAIKTLNAVENA